jgi:Domain of unknown function (DUF4136)
MQGKVSVRPERRASLRSLAFIFLLLSALGRPVAAKATTDFDPGLDFSKFKAYAFVGGVGNLVMLQLDPDFIYTRIHKDVQRELDKKGLHEVAPNQNPDLVVRFWVAPGSQVNVDAMGNWAPYSSYTSGYWGRLYSSEAVTTDKINTLILDLVDPKSKSLAWRLYITRRLADPDKDWKKADDDFAEGFKSYPPSDKEKSEKAKEHQGQKP